MNKMCVRFSDSVIGSPQNQEPLVKVNTKILGGGVEMTFFLGNYNKMHKS